MSKYIYNNYSVKQIITLLLYHIFLVLGWPSYSKKDACFFTEKRGKVLRKRSFHGEIATSVVLKTSRTIDAPSACEIIQIKLTFQPWSQTTSKIILHNDVIRDVENYLENIHYYYISILSCFRTCLVEPYDVFGAV